MHHIYNFTIPLGATVVIPGLPGAPATAALAVEQLRYATAETNASATIVLGSSTDWKVEVPDSEAVRFKLIAHEVIAEFGT